MLYNDLGNFSKSDHTHSWNNITGRPTTFTPNSHNHSWSEITSKPSTFAPSSHTHNEYSPVSIFTDTDPGNGAITDYPEGTLICVCTKEVSVSSLDEEEVTS